ncbi:hypothetical protein, partial [Acidiphilium sp.]|uniref:hypothetical protein n=1 Tax=Acidiphilium sp. TaxID=527 RepID=UPI003D054E24
AFQFADEVGALHDAHYTHVLRPIQDDSKPPNQMNKSFLVLFCKKERLALVGWRGDGRGLAHRCGGFVPYRGVIFKKSYVRILYTNAMVEI